MFCHWVCTDLKKEFVMKNESSDRRAFLKAIVAAPVAIGFARLAFGQGAKPATPAPAATKPATPAAAANDPLAGAKWLDVNGPLAANVKNYAYVPDAKDKPKDAPAKVCAAGEQICANCVFHTAPGKKDGKEAVLCSLFANNAVPAGAWCNKWMKGPKDACKA